MSIVKMLPLLHAALLFFAMVAVPGMAVAQGVASGTLTVNKDKFQIKYSAAIATKEGTRIVVGDKPIPLDVLDDDVATWQLKETGFHGLQIDLSEDRNSVSVFVITNTVQASLSSSQSGNLAKQSKLGGGRVEGSFSRKPDAVGDESFGYDVKFSTAITPPTPEPTAADTAAAAGKDSTKAYLALMEAIRKGNKAGILAASPPERRAMIDTPDFPQVLKMVQGMQAKNIKVLKASETADTAILIATGAENGKPQRGRITMKKRDNKWLMENESWGPAPK